MNRLGLPRSLRTLAVDRLLARVVDVDGCWVWQGADNGVGYGVIASNGRQTYTHRVAYEFFIGPVPAGLVLDHLCRVRRCCNPWHLDPVTHRVNLLRGVGVSAVAASRTACPQGHPYDQRNTYRYPNGSRRCMACARDDQRARRARNRTAA